jgi:hypothetical protein
MGYIPWQEKRVEHNYNIMWECESGMVLGRAQKPKTFYYNYDLWGMLGANAVRFGSGAAPTAGSFTNFVIPQDNFAPPRKIFFFNQPKTFIQVFPGLNQPDLYYFLRMPQGQPLGGSIGYLGNADSNYRYPYGWWFRGQDSDIDNATDAGEFWVPPGIDLEHSVVNTLNERVRPQCLFNMVQFSFDPYNPKTEVGKKMIKAILSGNLPVSDGSIGGKHNFNYPEQSFKSAFGVQPVVWDGGTASYLQDGKEIRLFEV